MIVVWIILILFLVWTLVPFTWMFFTSFKSRKDIYKLIIVPFLQYEPTLEHWDNILIKHRTFHLAITNSLIVATISSLVVLAVGLLAGYALSRFRFERWKNRDISVWILSQRMLPPVAVLIPFFLIVRNLRLLDTWLGIILAHFVFNLPLAVWLLRDFFNEIPLELEEASLVDGCTRLGTFLRITLPLSAPGLIVVFVLNFIFSWNEFLFAMTLTYNKAYTLPVLIASTVAFRQMEWWNLSVYVTMAVIPPAILAMIFERYFVRGLTLGAVKF